MNDLVLLASLTEGPKHGYQLKKEARVIFGGGELHNNLVYPLLHRFQRNGWVTRKSVPGERGQNRFQYALTQAGRGELVRRLSADMGPGESDEAFYMRVALLPMLDVAARRKVLDERQGRLETDKRHLENITSHFSEVGSFPGEVLGFLRRKAQFELDWIKTLRDQADRNDLGAHREATACGAKAKRNKRRRGFVNR